MRLEFKVDGQEVHVLNNPVNYEVGAKYSGVVSYLRTEGDTHYFNGWFGEFPVVTDFTIDGFQQYWVRVHLEDEPPSAGENYVLSPSPTGENFVSPFING